MAIIFADTNVFLDSILERTNYYEDCQELLQLSQSGYLQIKTSASCLVNVIYFFKKAGLDKNVIIEILTELLKTLSLIQTDEKTFAAAMHECMPALLISKMQYNIILHYKLKALIISSLLTLKIIKKRLLTYPLLLLSNF